ncbi:DUF222 domain-containing protein [Arthrobacter sp. UYEF36]|uniref:HNH endonuclease signature motif containing protein n=1 Tax=Arthrobacter sp. UYEF36 TaxID=1756366 RepID=UPI003399EDDB
METVRDFIAFEDTARDAEHSTGRGTSRAGQPGMDGMEDALTILRNVGLTAVDDAALLGFQAASDFAGTVEEAARVVEYLQLVAAGAVDRTRKQATAAPSKASTSWTTGWRESSGPGAFTEAGTGAGSVGPVSVSAAASEAVNAPADTDSPAVAVAVNAPADAEAQVVAIAVGVAVDDGYRNTTEFLRARLRISAAEARRRLALAGSLLPREGFTGEPLPPVHGELSAAVAAGEVASRAATLVTLALDRVRHVCDAEASARMEHALTRTAAENDPDFLARVARSWTDALDQDGAEPSEELLRQLQGAFIRKPRHGLQHLEIFATAEQFEHLLTVMNTATNPRTGAPQTPGTPEAPGTAAAGEGSAGGPAAAAATLSAGASTEASPWADAGNDGGNDGGSAGVDVPLDLRSRPQKHLDGLVGACKAALAAGTLPAAGGLRPQVMVTIDYRDLLARLGSGDSDLLARLGQLAQPGRPGDSHDDTTASQGTAAIGPFRAGQATGQTGTLLFTGPITASTVRKIACDADIIPVLLGSEGRILDIGRASRVFPPHIRKALTARDQGCAFPGCTIPAPWCEAHHITYWSRGGTTGTENGTLLCYHHHHLIHKEQWTIQVRTGIPWFIPPPHIDPRQNPRRNYYFRPADLGRAA